MCARSSIKIRRWLLVTAVTVFESLVPSSFGDDQNLPVEGPVKLSKDRPRHASRLPMIAIPVQRGLPVRFYQMHFDSSEVGEEKLSLSSKKFIQTGTAEVKPGTALEIDTFVLSNHLVAAYQMLTWKTDYPSIEDFKRSLDTTEPDRFFFEIVARLSEERRHARDLEEYVGFLKQNRNPKTAHQRGQFSNYLFPTGYVEVSGKSLGAQDKDIRYFITLNDLKTLATRADHKKDPNDPGEEPLVRLDLKLGKLKVLQSLTVMTFRELSDENTRPEIIKAASELEHICSSGQCAFSEERSLGNIMMDVTRIFSVGTGDFTGLEPSPRLSYCKQLCILKQVRQICPGLKGLAPVDAWIQKEKLNCDDPDSFVECAKGKMPVLDR
jgi:hypothetical protein